MSMKSIEKQKERAYEQVQDKFTEKQFIEKIRSHKKIKSQCQSSMSDQKYKIMIHCKVIERTKQFYAEYFNAKRRHQAYIYCRDTYVVFCLSLQLYGGFLLSERYMFQYIGVKGPSMLPTIDERDNILLLDTFTTRFIRNPKRNEIIRAENPFKPNSTIIKRVLFLEGEIAEFYDKGRREFVRVKIPPNHIWVEGDNKDNSRDSRDIGPLSLELVDGIVRKRLWPLSKFGSLGQPL